MPIQPVHHGSALGSGNCAALAICMTRLFLLLRPYDGNNLVAGYLLLLLYRTILHLTIDEKLVITTFGIFDSRAFGVLHFLFSTFDLFCIESIVCTKQCQ
jgi:hypothetical protein